MNEVKRVDDRHSPLSGGCGLHPREDEKHKSIFPLHKGKTRGRTGITKKVQAGRKTRVAKLCQNCERGGDMPATYTPLRYPGGKTKLYDEIKPLLHSVGDSAVYVEPFAGGAGLALKLLFYGDAESIVLNDIDENIYSFWMSCLNQTDELCQMIKTSELSIEEWDRQREVLEHPDQHSCLERAFALFYMNRCNRSGIIKGGPIGGRNQNGNYKLDVRFNKQGLIKKIKDIGNRRNSISVYCMDGKRFLTEICQNLPRNALINIDPPYVSKGPELYQNSFSKQDHIDLSKTIKGLSHKWVVTYDVNELIRDLYNDFPMRDIVLGYSAGSQRKTGHEYLITNIAQGAEKDV